MPVRLQTLLLSQDDFLSAHVALSRLAGTRGAIGGVFAHSMRDKGLNNATNKNPGRTAGVLYSSLRRSYWTNSKSPSFQALSNQASSPRASPKVIVCGSYRLTAISALIRRISASSSGLNLASVSWIATLFKMPLNLNGTW